MGAELYGRMEDCGGRLVTQPGQNQVYVPVKDLGPSSKRLPGNMPIDHIDLNVTRS